MRAGDTNLDVAAESGVDPIGRSRWPPTLQFAIGCWFALWGLVEGLAPLRDNSFLTHLATGRLILESGIPDRDPFSSTAFGEPWVVQSWLPATAYAWLEQSWGLVAVRLLTASLTAGLGVITWRLTRRADGLVIRLLVSALAVATGSGFWAPRPLLWGLLFLGLTLLAAQDDLPAPVLLVVYAVWANSHASFPVGLVVLGVLLLGRRIDDRTTGAVDVSAEVNALGWAAAGSAIGALGPLGFDALRFPVVTLGRADVLRSISEWQSPTFDRPSTLAFGILSVLAVVAAVRSRSWRAFLPLVLFVPAALVSQRNVPVAALVLLPGTVGGLREIGHVHGWSRGALTGALAGLAAVAAGLVVPRDLRSPHLDLSGYPVAALDWIDSSGLAEDELFTSETVGNLLTLRRGASAAVFIDDRFDFYPIEVIEDFLLVRRAGTGWEEVLARYDVDVVLWELPGPLPSALRHSDAWVVVYEDTEALVVCRRSESACLPPS